LPKNQYSKRFRKKKKKGVEKSKGKKKKILGLIREISLARGHESEDLVIQALQQLKGAVECELTEKYSLDDLSGRDMLIKVRMFCGGEKKDLKFSLQIKSSYLNAVKFIEEGDGKIPVLVREPGASCQEIIQAFSRIVERKVKGAKNIIEIAEAEKKK
jgi:hypothetical protein